MPTVAIVVAAGQGTRFGSELPKQFLMLNDKPVLAHTLHRFERAQTITEVVIVAAQAWIPYIGREIVGRFDFKKCREIVPGGDHRQDSVWAGLKVAKNLRCEVVVVHDAVRPLFSLSLLERVVAACETNDGAIPVIVPRDTVKAIEGQEIKATLPRETIRLAQTPQAFRRTVLEKAFVQAQKEEFRCTDESALVERAGGRIAWIEGEESNLKITTPRDLQIAEIFVREVA